MLGEGHAVPIDRGQRETYLAACAAWASSLETARPQAKSHGCIRKLASMALRALVEEVRRKDEEIVARDDLLARVGEIAKRIVEARKAGCKTSIEAAFAAQKEFMREVEFVASMEFRRRI